MHDLLQVLSAAQSTGTERGISYYSTRCARKVRLDREHGRGESSYSAMRGTVFHKVMELYHSGRLQSSALPVTDTDPKEDPVAEGLRLARGYMSCYGPQSLGEVVGTEILFPAADKPEQAAALLSRFGVPLTGRLDLVTQVVEPVKGLDLLPGLYLVDYKTVDKRASDVLTKHLLSPQFVAYVTAWNTLVPQHPLLGTIVQEAAGLQKLDESCFRRFYIPGPTEMEVDGLIQWLKWKESYFTTDLPNLDACSDWSACHHWRQGRCLRA